MKNSSAFLVSSIFAATDSICPALIYYISLLLLSFMVLFTLNSQCLTSTSVTQVPLLSRFACKQCSSHFHVKDPELHYNPLP